MGAEDTVEIYYLNTSQNMVLNNITYGVDESNNTVVNYNAELFREMNEDVNISFDDLIQYSDNQVYRNRVQMVIHSGELTASTYNNIGINYNDVIKQSSVENKSWSHKGERRNSKYVYNMVNKYTYGNDIINVPEVSLTPTPTTTPTISLTPTLTPTITQTPSVTPTSGTTSYNALSFYDVCSEEYFTVITGGTLEVVGSMEYIEIGKYSKHSYTELIPFKWWGCYQRVEYNSSYTQYTLNEGSWVWLERSYDSENKCLFDDAWPNSKCFEHKVSLSGCCDGSVFNVGTLYGGLSIGESARLINQTIVTSGHTELVIGNCYTRIPFDSSYPDGPNTVTFNYPNYYLNPNHCISQNPCDDISCEVEFIPLIADTSNTSIKNNIFTFKESKSKGKLLEVDDKEIKKIKTNKFSKINFSLPKTDGTIVGVELTLSKNGNSKFTVNNVGNSSNPKKVDSLLTTYNVTYNKKLVGSIGFADDGIYGLYEIDGDVVTIKKSQERNTIAVTSGDTTSDVLSCGSDSLDNKLYRIIDGKYDHEHAPPNPDGSEFNHYHNMSVIADTQNTNSGVTINSITPLQYYSIGVVWDIPYNTYLKVQEYGGNPQLYVEIHHLNLNAAYVSGFNGDVEFRLDAAVIWNVPDPYQLLNQNSTFDSSTQYIDDVGIYYRDNHNTLLPGLNYNIVVQLNVDRHPRSTHRGAAHLYGLYDGNLDLDINYNNVAMMYGHKPFYDFNETGTTEGLNYIVVAHEVGHMVLGLHIWDDAPWGGNYTTAQGECTPSVEPLKFCSTIVYDCPCTCCRDENLNVVEECATLMSYCQGDTSFRFHPLRIYDFYLNAQVHGQSLLKDSILESYYTIDISNTPFVNQNYTYSIEYKSCDGSEWTLYGDDFIYYDFLIKIPESELNQYGCYDFRITVNNTQAVCEKRLYPYSEPSNTPTPTQTPTPFLTPTQTPLPSQTPSTTPKPPDPSPPFNPLDFDSSIHSRTFIPCNEDLFDGTYFRVILFSTEDGTVFYFTEFNNVVSFINPFINNNFQFLNNQYPNLNIEDYICLKCVDVPQPDFNNSYVVRAQIESLSSDELIITECDSSDCLIPTPTPTPTVTITPYLTPSNTPSNTPTPSVTPSITPTISITPTPTQTRLEINTSYVYYPNK
jgi:hypothetical protein